MKKMFNKAVLNGTTVMGDGLTYPRIPNVYTGDNEGGYQRGDMMDANAVVEMIKELTDTGKITIDELKNLINEEIQERVEGDQDQQRYTDEKIKDLIGTSPETLDTLKEIANALGEDPDFAANVWNKIAELTTKHNEDVQELQDAITNGFENIDFTPYVKKTDVVTDTTNGLMLASDKVKLDAFEEAEQYTKAPNLPDSVISNIDTSLDFDGINLKFTKDNLIDGNNSEVILQIPIAKPNVTHGLLSLDYAGRIASLPYNIIYSININQRNAEYVDINWQYNTLSGGSSGYGQSISPATTSIAGVMSASDKQKLDSLVKYKAGNGINITGDTISCTLDTSLYSIVTELPETGLPNKIYLLPSTKTEEGNIYTEYGYVDNKWEEIGKYKADVDLSPYSKALHLPEYVLGGVDWDNAYILYYPNGIDIVFKYLNLINNRKIDTSLNIIPATTKKSGVMSSIDKRKLDGIEAGAQVNKIESVSVNGTPLEITNKGVNIPNAATEKDGMMSKADKTKLDSLENYTLPVATDTTLGGVKVPTTLRVVGADTPNQLGITPEGNLGIGYGLMYGKHSKVLSLLYFNGTNPSFTTADSITLPNASITEDGLMSKEDKAKFDSQPTIKASDATGVTDDDYVVIKKSEYQSILDRLSALENKA